MNHIEYMLKMERNAIDLFKKYKNIDYKKEYDNLVYDKVLYEVNKKTNEVCSEYGRYDKYYDERNKMFNRTSHYKKGKLLKEKPDVDSYWIYYYKGRTPVMVEQYVMGEIRLSTCFLFDNVCILVDNSPSYGKCYMQLNCYEIEGDKAKYLKCQLFNDNRLGSIVEYDVDYSSNTWEVYELQSTIFKYTHHKLDEEGNIIIDSSEIYQYKLDDIYKPENHVMVISFPVYLFDGDQNGKDLVVTRNSKDVKEIPDELLQKYKLGRYRWRRRKEN